jgi:hypothetical protein
MDSAQLIKLTISASVLLLVFALGLRATFPLAQLAQNRMLADAT